MATENTNAESTTPNEEAHHLKLNVSVTLVGRDIPYYSSIHLSKSHQKQEHIRFSVNCAEGNQNFKWIGSVVCEKYSRGLQHHRAEFVPINIINADRLTLFPWQKINDRCKHNDNIEVEILGPGIGPHDPLVQRERTVTLILIHISLPSPSPSPSPPPPHPHLHLHPYPHFPQIWEMYAYSDPSLWLKHTFVFIVEGENPVVEDIGVTGNFSAWQKPLPLQFVGHGKYEIEMMFPPGTLLLFRFVRDGKFVFADNYMTVEDTEHQKFHYQMVMPKGSMLKMSSAEMMVTPRVSGTPRGRFLVDPTALAGKQLSEADIVGQKLQSDFDHDWDEVEMQDITRNEQIANELKDVRLCVRLISACISLLTYILSLCH